jgi:hypothetical protein
LALWIALASDGRSSTESMQAVAQALWRHMAQGVRDARLGDWVSYRVDGGGGRVSFWRFSVVGAEKDPLRGHALWIEIDIGQERELVAPLAQVKALVARELGLSRPGVLRLWLALGADKPQEVSPDKLAQLFTAGLREHPWIPAIDEVVRAGSEARLMTLAGTLPAVPIEIFQRGVLIQRFWISRRLPLLHLAKIEIPAIGHSVEVSGFGVDARARMPLPAPATPGLEAQAVRDVLP